MTREERFKEILDEMAELYRRKNADYGDSFHRAWEKFGPTVGLVYMDAKLNRINQLLKHPDAQQVHSEKIDDTLIDLANYAVLTDMEVREISYETALQCIDRLSYRLEATLSRSVEQILSYMELLNNMDCLSLLGYHAIVLKIKLEEQRNGIESEVSTISIPSDETSYPSPKVRIILEEGGIMPKKATDGSAGYDLFAPTNWIVMPGRNAIPLNFRMALPKGLGATPNPRSGFTLKGFEGYRSWKGDYMQRHENLVPVGEPCRMNADVIWGLIDSDYRGVCGVLVVSHEKEPFLLAKGTKFAQMCFQQYEDVDFQEVTELDDTDRSGGGFGHTGTK